MCANRVLMLLTNAYDPDPRVRQEALSLLAMGCHVRVLAWDRDMTSVARATMEGVEVERIFLASKHGRGLSQIFWYAVLYLRFFWRGLRTAFDVVHCHDLDTLAVGYALAKLKGKPLVYDAHESFPDMLADTVPRPIRALLSMLQRHLMRRCTLVITVGEKLRRHLAAEGARRSVVVGNWKRLADFSRTPAQNLEVRRALGIPDTGLVVACITQLLPDRKIDELLAAAGVCSNVYVLIAGKGVLADRVERAAAVNPRILFPGFVTGGTIADYTCAADVVYYGFDPTNPNARFSAPNKLYEALAAGRPLIAGNFGEIAEVIRDAECGIVLPEYSLEAITNALTELADPQKRQTLAENAARVGRTSLNWETGQEQLFREYSALLPGLRRPDPDAVTGLAAVPATRS
jgi:glycosyltransferase involved in cell wall biosynthesis